MKTVASMLIRLFIVLFSLGTLSTADELQYTVTQADQSEIRTVIITENTVEEKGKYTQKWQLDADQYTTRWEYSNSTENSHLIVTKTGHTLSYTGTYRGKQVSQEQTIKNHPWIQHCDVSLPQKSLVQTKTRFWYIRSRDLKPILFTLTNKSTPKTPHYYQIHISPWPSLLWKIEYWLDDTQQTIVQKRVSGSPILMMKLNEN